MTAQEVTAWVGTRTVARQAQEQARAERRECRREVARVCEVLALRVDSEAREDIRHHGDRRRLAHSVQKAVGMAASHRRDGHPRTHNAR